MKKLLYKIAAIWTVLVFAITLLLVALPIWITYLFKDPKGVEVFRRISVVWISTFLFLAGCRLRVKGRNNFKKGETYIVTCNHNSFIDVPTLTPFVPGPNKTIAKIELSRIPIFGMIYTRGSVLVDRKDPASRQKSFEEMKMVLANRLHMCLYPEGTRNKTERPLQSFKGGAFRLALQTGKDIVPALIFNTHNILPAGKGLYFKPGKIELHFLEPVKVSDFSNYQSLRDHIHTVMERYYVEHEEALEGKNY